MSSSKIYHSASRKSKKFFHWFLYCYIKTFISGSVGWIDKLLKCKVVHVYFINTNGHILMLLATFLNSITIVGHCSFEDYYLFSPEYDLCILYYLPMNSLITTKMLPFSFLTAPLILECYPDILIQC